MCPLELLEGAAIDFMKKNLLLQISLVLVAVSALFFLFSRPKYIVEESHPMDLNGDKESVSSTTQERTMSNHNPEHDVVISQIDSIKTLYSVSFEEKKLIFADSLGRLYRSIFEYDSSATYYELASEYTEDVKADLKAGVAYYDAFRFTNALARKQSYAERAKEYIERYLQVYPEDEFANVKRAVLMVYTETPPMKGINALKDVIAKNPNNIEALESLGEFQFTVQKYDKAIVQFKKVVALDSTQVNALWYLSQCYKAVDDAEEAIRYLNKIKELELNDVYINKLVEDGLKELK